MERGLTINTLMALVWTFLFTPSPGMFLTGGLIAFLFIALFQRVLYCEEYVRRVVGFLRFCLIFLREFVVSDDFVTKLASSIVYDEAPGATEEFIDAADGLRIPGLYLLKRAHEHFIHPKRVGSILADDVVGVNDIASRLRHLLVIFSEDHPLIYESFEGLARRDHTDIVKHVMPESRIEEVEHRVLDAAYVEVNRHPILLDVLVPGFSVVFWVEKTQIVPTTPRPLWHGVCFARCRFPRLGVSRIHPVNGTG